MLHFRRLLPMAMAAALIAPAAWADGKDGPKQRREAASREHRDDDRRASDGYYEGDADYGRGTRAEDGYWRDDNYGRDEREWRKAEKEREKDRRKARKEAEKERREAEREWAKDRREAEREWEKDRREARREARKERRNREYSYPDPY